MTMTAPVQRDLVTLTVRRKLGHVSPNSGEVVAAPQGSSSGLLDIGIPVYQDITCAVDLNKLQSDTLGWLVESIDENGDDVTLTDGEIYSVRARALDGEDETGN